jgi:methyl-accepting chemotaxis protein
MSQDLNPKGGKYNRSVKNLVINARYQMKYIFWLSSTGLVLMLANSATFYFFVKENYDLLVELSPMSDEAKQQLYRELYQIIGYLVVGNLTFLVLISILGLVYSHRTAGPLYHFKRVFNEVKQGNSKARVRLRPTDDFRDVAEAFNDMMDKING